MRALLKGPTLVGYLQLDPCVSSQTLSFAHLRN
jgi:hypothetical protein